MPHLRFRGCDDDLLECLTPVLVARLAEVIGCPPDWITVESVPTRYLTRPSLAFAEVLWFDRGATMQDGVARVLAEIFAARGAAVPTVLFTRLAKGDYYEDGLPV